MTATYDLIASSVLSASAASVTFSSVPQTYRDIVVVITQVDDATTNTPTVYLRFNNDSGSNYPYVFAQGTGASASSVAYTETGVICIAFPATNGRALGIANIMDYSVTDKHKTVLTRGNNAAEGVDMAATRWANTAAITTITITGQSSDRQFDPGSTFYLYGIVS